MPLDEYEKQERAFRKAFRQDRDVTGSLIRITVKNPSRPSAVRGIRTGSWGRSVRCVTCDRIVASNNERGADAQRSAEIVAGQHLLEEHPDRIKLAEEKPYRLVVTNCTKQEAKVVADAVRAAARIAVENLNQDKPHPERIQAWLE